MNIKQIEKTLIDSGIEPNEAKIEAKMLVKHFLKYSDTDLVLKSEFAEDNALLDAVTLRVKKRIPVQHIIGTAYFMGEDFIVNEHVLIPRDETELLVRSAIHIINANKFKKVLDIGTGTGCIACMIAKLSSAQVIGVDISTEALQIALDNASKLRLFNKAIFRKSDVFSNVKGDEKFDMIISNPPYIPIKERHRLQKEVAFDPSLALFAADDKGVEFYERIAKDAPKFLNKGGYLMFELGVNQAKIVVEILKANHFEHIEIQKDFAGIERIISARK